MLPVNQLRAFVAVVEAGTVTAASAASAGRSHRSVGWYLASRRLSALLFS